MQVMVVHKDQPATSDVCRLREGQVSLPSPFVHVKGVSPFGSRVESMLSFDLATVGRSNLATPVGSVAHPLRKC